jgi:hypothetical protein
MEYASYTYLGIGIALSVLGFFLKRQKEQGDATLQKLQDLERHNIELTTKVYHLEKLVEDRRQAEIAIFKELQDKR